MMGHWAALSKFAADTKLRGLTDTPKDCAAVQKRVTWRNMEKREEGNLVKVNEGKVPSFAPELE